MFFYYALNFFCALYSCTVEQPVLVESRQVDGVLQQHYYLQTEPFENFQDNEIPENPIVWTRDGGLRGFQIETITKRKVLAFQGIPFAQPPVGPLRFREPVKNLPWKGVRDAIALSPTCIQVDFFQMYKLSGQEDCLYINVYTHKIPKRGHNYNLPVLVGIHQGGFFFGSTNLLGPAYLMDENVVLVTMNYRLGALGFLSTGDAVSPGNNGLKDQVLALQWVQENIHHFGGDPNRITIFGESSGASAVQYHMLSPLSRGLFQSGISNSGCAFCFWSVNERGVELTQRLANILHCPTQDSLEMVECMRNINASTIVGSQVALLEWASYPVALFTPVIEPSLPGAFLDDLPENIYKKPNGVARVPWMTGVNTHELSTNVAGILLSPEFTKDFNEEWETKVGPALMEVDNSTSNDYRATLRAIRQHYMGDDPLTFENRFKALQMLDDRYLKVCGHKAIRYHAELADMPVYAYYLSYRGKYSVVELLGQKPEDWGVAHIDDMIYLTNNTAYYPNLSVNDTEYEMSRIMTSMWANFAAYGIPFISKNGEQHHVWQPVTKQTVSDLRFLDLTLQPKMIPDPFKEGVRFWRSIRLHEADYYDTRYDSY
ncbi:unnamed protein product [Allacma fusca]|uniref:Carboxylic ester hydrolase n=1 Tax=Allacma fusca TaxID=39272 RepID=A0A8J2NYX4_9HEXA|nr:unnamed protein product [Allacma fusca]